MAQMYDSVSADNTEIIQYVIDLLMCKKWLPIADSLLLIADRDSFEIIFY